MESPENTRKTKKIRLLYVQLVFVAFAFGVIVVSCGIFVNNMLINYMRRDAEAILTQTQLRISSELREPQTLMLHISEEVREILLNGGNRDDVLEFYTKTSAALRNKTEGFEFAGIQGYFYKFGDNAYIPALGWEVPEGYDATVRPWYIAALTSNGNITASPMYLSLRSNEYQITYVRMLFDDDGERLGIVGMNVPLGNIMEFIMETRLTESGYGILTDENFNMVAHPEPSYIGKSISELSSGFNEVEKRLRLNEEDIPRVEDVNYKDTRSVFYGKKIENGWSLGLMTPRNEYYRDYYTLITFLSVLGVVMLFVVCVILIRIDAARHRTDVELQKSLVETKRLRDEAHATNIAKSAFLANMSHEIRTPLTAVLGLTELTLKTAQLDDETYSNIVKVNRAGETLLGLINTILDISKIEAGKFELFPFEYDLPSLINDTITQSIMYVGDKPIELILDIREDLPSHLYGDELRLKQIMNNLLSNAFKYTKEGTVEMGLRCERDGESVWLTVRVRDTGIGIRAEDFDKLFTHYGKMEGENRSVDPTRRIESTGLGLSISKQVAEMMDGTITVESEYLKGSVFTVRVRQGYISDAKIGPEVVESLKNFHYSTNNLKQEKTSHINLSYAKVLVVDDNSTNLDVAKGLMGLYGMRVDCVTSGRQAINLLREGSERYDAIFMDHMMPEMDGVEAARLIREINTKYTKTVPIIALTANAIAGNEELLLSKGFQAFISKPIDPTRLDTVLRQWVRNKEEEAQLIGDAPVLIKTQESRFSGGDIPGLDIDKGFARFGYDMDTYLDVLRSFAEYTKPLLNDIKNVGEDDLSEYAVTVHGIKGSCYSIFATDIGDGAKALEFAATAKDINFVNSANLPFINAVSRLIADIEVMLAKNNKAVRPLKAKPDEELLVRFLAACDSFDIDVMDAAMAEIESYAYDSDGGLAVWLRESLDKGKYKAIKEKLIKLIGGKAE